MKQTAKAQHTDKDTAISYAGYRFPPELISYAVWLYFRFALSLRMVEEMLAARGIEVTYETVHRWALKAARRIRARSIGCGERWISLASCWTSWCQADATGMRPRG